MNYTPSITRGCKSSVTARDSRKEGKEKKKTKRQSLAGRFSFGEKLGDDTRQAKRGREKKTDFRARAVESAFIYEYLPSVTASFELTVSSLYESACSFPGTFQIFILTSGKSTDSAGDDACCRCPSSSSLSCSNVRHVRRISTRRTRPAIRFHLCLVYSPRVPFPRVLFRNTWKFPIARPVRPRLVSLIFGKGENASVCDAFARRFFPSIARLRHVLQRAKARCIKCLPMPISAVLCTRRDLL